MRDHVDTTRVAWKEVPNVKTTTCHTMSAMPTATLIATGADLGAGAWFSSAA